jgi:hypothetical protein
VPPWRTLGSAIFREFFLRSRGPQLLSLRLSPKALYVKPFLRKIQGKPAVKNIIYILKILRWYGRTPEPQTAQDARWLHGPSLKNYTA